MVGWTANEIGEIVDEDGVLVGRVELISSDQVETDPDQARDLRDSLLQPFVFKAGVINEEGQSLDEDGGLIGSIKEEQDLEILAGKIPNEEGQILEV